MLKETGREILKPPAGGQVSGAAWLGQLRAPSPGDGVGRAGVVWGAVGAGEQAGTARGWSVWTGGSGILCVCCFSNQEAGFGICLSHSLRIWWKT